MKNIMGKEDENKKRTVISRGIIIKGEVEGTEPLTIEGKIEGNINLEEHIHVAIEGEVNAQIETKSIVIAGSVSGNIAASDRVEILACGSMIGDIKAPNVILTDGCIFRGKIDMEIDDAKIEERRRTALKQQGGASVSSGPSAGSAASLSTTSSNGYEAESASKSASSALLDEPSAPKQAPKPISAFLRQV